MHQSTTKSSSTEPKTTSKASNGTTQPGKKAPVQPKLDSEAGEFSFENDVPTERGSSIGAVQTKSLANLIGPSVRRKPYSGSEEKEEVNDSFESQLNSSKGGGRSLPNETRDFMGSRFGADFSGVKIHTGSNAVQMNQEVGAKAFAHGQDIYFNEGQYKPSSREGKHLLAHELTHTMQQGGEKIRRFSSIRGRYITAIKYNLNVHKRFTSGLIWKLYLLSGDRDLYNKAKRSRSLGYDFASLVGDVQASMGLSSTGKLDGVTIKRGMWYLRKVKYNRWSQSYDTMTVWKLGEISKKHSIYHRVSRKQFIGADFVRLLIAAQKKLKISSDGLMGPKTLSKVFQFKDSATEVNPNAKDNPWYSGLVNKAIDGAILFMKSKFLLWFATRFPIAILIAPLVQNGILGFLEELKLIGVKKVLKVVRKGIRALTSWDFIWAFIKGFFSGFFADGLWGTVLLIKDLALLPKKMYEFGVYVYETIKENIEELKAIGSKLKGIGRWIWNNGWEKLMEIIAKIREGNLSAKVKELAGNVTGKIKGGIRNGGRKFAALLIRFLANLPGIKSTVGNNLGKVVGYSTFEIVFAVLTAGVGAAATATKTIVKSISKVIGSVAKNILKVIRFIRSMISSMKKNVMKVIIKFKDILGTKFSGMVLGLFKSMDDLVAKLFKKNRGKPQNKPGNKKESENDNDRKEGKFLPDGTRLKPIPIVWYKSIDDYEPLKMKRKSDNQVVEVDFKGSKKLKLSEKESINIGVAKKHWPEVGKIFHREKTKDKIARIKEERGSKVFLRGAKTNTFRKKLLRFFSNPPIIGKDIDHVRDIGFGGPDSFFNLWPLDKGKNLRGNQSYKQTVRYYDSSKKKVVKTKVQEINKKWVIIKRIN